jgi:undecaprenyl diphosphate synthase
MMAAMTRAAEPSAELRHVVLVAGTLEQWNAFGDAAWRERISELGKVVEQAGGHWLTIRPLDTAAPSGGGIPASIRRVGTCTAVVDPQTDGKHRVVQAINALRRDGRAVTDENIAAVINAPADCDPDLAVIAGPDDLLPCTLVWELAYCELVYVDTSWACFTGEQLEAAIAEFAGRHRRFGGLD